MINEAQNRRNQYPVCSNLPEASAQIAIWKAYRLGLAENQRRFDAKLSVLLAANRRLIEEVLRLDRAEPVDGIAISTLVARRIIRKLKKLDPADGHARVLSRLLIERSERLEGLLGQLEELAASKK
jgi:hypothetical protein